MSAEKKATRPGSRWAHGKRRVLPAGKAGSKDASKGYNWHSGAKVRKP